MGNRAKKTSASEASRAGTGERKGATGPGDMPLMPATHPPVINL